MYDEELIFIASLLVTDLFLPAKEGKFANLNGYMTEKCPEVAGATDLAEAVHAWVLTFSTWQVSLLYHTWPFVSIDGLSRALQSSSVVTMWADQRYFPLQDSDLDSV